MCEDCGCGDTKLVPVHVHTSLLARNQHEADHLRAHFRESHVTAVNLMGSPGAGKTALLEATAGLLGGRRRLAAVSGDLATTHDADRLLRAGVPAASITTGTACHLDASMVDRVLHNTPFGERAHTCDFFFIENVGNLVCPAIYDLGQKANVVCLSVTEGVDKPLKYPPMFRDADLVVLTKVDLLPYLPGVTISALADNLARVMVKPRFIEVSTVTPSRSTGLDAWVSFLEAQRDGLLAEAQGVGAGHSHGGHAHPHSHR